MLMGGLYLISTSFMQQILPSAVRLAYPIMIFGRYCSASAKCVD